MLVGNAQKIEKNIAATCEEISLVSADSLALIIWRYHIDECVYICIGKVHYKV